MQLTKSNVEVIPAFNIINESQVSNVCKRRVAAYARVSTEKDEQFISYTSQIDYYTNYIISNPNFEFVKVYTDDGITGTCTRLRPGFNEMISDALSGKIDLIITKSISRFARNTVDSLSTIRKLKEVNVECYFEKENIYTFDSKGELLITVLSSLAQEESRSISENVTWGIRKRFSDGIYYIHYKEFLGYKKGINNKPEIDIQESLIVKRIYYMYLEGLTYYKIANILNNEHIKTPSGKQTWYYTVIRSILTNEKYIGDALLQKTYSIDFLTKKRKQNEGILPKYYVKQGHDAIIDKYTFYEVQKRIDKTKHQRYVKGDKEFSKKVKCGICGNWYCETIWHKKKKVWRCNKKFKQGNCETPYIEPIYLSKLFDNFYNELLNNPIELKKSLSKLKFTKLKIANINKEIQTIDEYIQANQNEEMLKRKEELQNSLKINNIILKQLDELNIEVIKDLDLKYKLIDYITIYTLDNITVKYL